MLSNRQIKFVDEYILNGGNASAACRSAGYSAAYANRQAYKLLSVPEIRQAIDERLKQARTDKTLEQSQLLEFLSAVVRGEVQDEQLMTRLIGKGQSVIERHQYRVPTKDRIRAVEIMLRVLGAFDKREEGLSGADLFVSTLERINNHISA